MDDIEILKKLYHNETLEPVELARAVQLVNALRYYLDEQLEILD